MRKVAFFVEGQTEQIFVNRLTKEILGPQRTNIIQKKIKGGTTMPKQEIVRDRAISKDPWYEILIYDCGSDNRVKSEMLDNLENLSRQGYEMIIGLRDLFPMKLEELERLEKGLKFMPRNMKGMIDVFDVIVAVHEVETWFLAEASHFKRVDNRLTGEFIQKRLGFNPYKDNAVKREHPADDLDQIYKLIGRSYTKKYTPTRRIVNRLDYHNLLNNVSKKISSLGRLVGALQRIKRRNNRN